MKPARRKKTLCLAALPLALAIAGCTVFPQPETRPVKTYVLTFDPRAADAWPTCASPDGALLVSEPQQQAGFDTTGIAYLERAHEVKYYAYSRWAESPGQLIVPLLVQAMDRTRCWSTVGQPNTAIDTDYRLDSEIVHWQQEFFSKPSQVRLSIRVQLVNSKNRKVIAVRRFDTIEKAPSDNAYGAVTAANLAVNKLIGDITAWVKTNAPAARTPKLQSEPR